MKFLLYTLLLVKVLMGCTNPGPDKVLREYISYISTSQCERASDLCTDMAKDFVQGLIDMGCVPYESEIHSIHCNIDGDTAICECDETNQFGRFLLHYHMLRVDGEWKVHIEAQTEAQTR